MKSGIHLAFAFVDCSVKIAGFELKMIEEAMLSGDVLYCLVSSVSSTTI